jgi:hypothetical protein
MISKSLLIAALAVVVAGCAVSGEPPADVAGELSAARTVEGVMLTTDRSSYRAGAELRLDLRNETGDGLGVNVCVSTLEVRDGTDWRRSPQQPDEICTMELRILEPGASASHTFTLPAGLGSGEYRFVTDVERMESGERGPVASAPFTVDR